MTFNKQSSTGVRREGYEARIILLYILTFASGGVIQPFLNLYLLEVGLTSTEIGVILGWAALLTVVFTPAIGFLADRAQLHRLLLAIVIFIKGVAAPLVLLGNSMLWLSFTVTLRILNAGASDSLLTPLTFVYLREKTNNRSLGSLRFWGMVGFAAASLSAGFLAKGRSAGVLFPLAAVLGIAALFFITVLPKSVLQQETRSDDTAYLQRPNGIIGATFVLVFIYWIGFSGPDTFGNIYLADSLDAGNDFIGIVAALSILSQLPGYFIADRLNLKIGPEKTMLLGMGIHVLGWLGYLVIQIPLQIIPFIMIQGLGRAIYSIGMFVLLQQKGQARRSTMDLMAANITLPGLAAMIAKPVSGYIYDHLGGSTLFLFDIVLVGGLIIFWLMRRQK